MKATLTIADRPALILIDIQKGFDNITYWGGERNNPDAEKNAGELLKLWREKKLPLFHIRHGSSDPASPLSETNKGHEFNDLVTPTDNEIVITKKVNSAFIGTDLAQKLTEAKIKTLVIAGLTTDHCVSTTTRMAGNLGFATYLVSDATAAFNRRGLHGQNFPADLIHETALASLSEEFSVVVTTNFLKESLLH